MRTKWVVLGIVSLILGALGGALVAPQPAGAVSKEMIELQEQVAQILQAQQDLRSALDADNASLKTLVQQQADAINHLNTTMGSLQSAVQQVQANAGSQIGTVAQQTQGLSDNLQDVQARVGKLQQQMTDMQNLLQSIDSKVSAAAPQNPQPNGTQPGPGTNGQNGTSTSTQPGTDPNGAAGNNPPVATNTPSNAMPPISADTLYQNALRDYNSGNYPLANQEFSDYIRNFPRNDLASNAQFYLGEILYAQGDYKSAVDSYDSVLTNYPNSFKLSDSLLKKAMAEQKLRERVSAQRDYRLVVRRFPGSPSARKAEAMLREMGAQR
ncbi:MAG TPA: tol-pal system protein YbgF [Candidatus Acidoferrum sp.]|nr:tol-pal system protein YbgF [Candidatus Acidoferrum sp.]